VPDGRQRGHVDADLGDQHLRRGRSDTGDGLHPAHVVGERPEQVGDPLVEAVDQRIEMIDVIEMQPDHGGAVRTEASDQGPLELRDLDAHLLDPLALAVRS
jgi:hypothetical protein